MLIKIFSKIDMPTSVYSFKSLFLHRNKKEVSSVLALEIFSISFQHVNTRLWPLPKFPETLYMKQTGNTLKVI